MKLIGLDLGGNRTPFQNMTADEEKQMKAELEETDSSNVAINSNRRMYEEYY